MKVLLTSLLYLILISRVSSGFHKFARIESLLSLKISLIALLLKQQFLELIFPRFLSVDLSLLLMWQSIITQLQDVLSTFKIKNKAYISLKGKDKPNVLKINDKDHDKMIIRWALI